MGPQSRFSVSWAMGAFRHYGYAALRRYRQLGIRGKVRTRALAFATFVSRTDLITLLVHLDLPIMLPGHLDSHTDHIRRHRSGPYRPGAV